MSCYFTEGGAKRVVAATTRAERGYRNPPPGSYGSPPDGSSGLLPLHCKTSTTIGPATSSTQMTSGVVAIYRATDTGQLIDTGFTVKVWNKSTSASVGANKHIIVFPMDGGYVVVWEEC